LSGSSLARSILLRSVFEVRDVIPDGEETLAALLINEVWGRPSIPDETVCFIHASFSYRKNWWRAVKHQWGDNISKRADLHFNAFGSEHAAVGSAKADGNV
jgi:hypothetical protein